MSGLRRVLWDAAGYLRIALKAFVPGTKLALQFGYRRMMKIMLQSDSVARRIVDPDSLFYTGNCLFFSLMNPPLSVVSCREVSVKIKEVEKAHPLWKPLIFFSEEPPAKEEKEKDGKPSPSVRYVDSSLLSSRQPFDFSAGMNFLFCIPDREDSLKRLLNSSVHILIRFYPVYFGTRGHLEFRGFLRSSPSFPPELTEEAVEWLEKKKEGLT